MRNFMFNKKFYFFFSFSTKSLYTNSFFLTSRHHFKLISKEKKNSNFNESNSNKPTPLLQLIYYNM